MKAQLALRMKYRLRRYESGTMCRMALAYTPELPNSNLSSSVFKLWYTWA